MVEEALRTEFFVTRNDGKMVPLIAVDELPHHIIIAGVSRIMSPFDISGMTCIGRSDFRHRFYNVNNASELAAGHAPLGNNVLKPKFFITRDSGNMVPLVAMDEMPEKFVIEGVPRSVSAFEISGMTCIGVADARDQLHLVEDVNNPPLSYFTGKMNTGHASGGSNSRTGTPLSDLAPSVNSAKITQQAPVKQFDSSASNAGISTPPASDSGNPTAESPVSRANTSDSFQHESRTATPELSAQPGPTVNPALESGGLPNGTKEFCSYWIRHGECDYQQQGCLYKHEMPLDKITLSRLGLRDIPRWYREKHCLGSYLAAGGAGGAFGDQGLKSAVASGRHEEDKKHKLAGNWRASPHNAESSPSPMNVHQRHNVYNPRSARVVISPTSFSRLPSAKTSGPLANGKLRSNETLHRRQQFETIQALETYAKIDGDRQKFAAIANNSANPNGAKIYASDAGSNLGRNRRNSGATLMSDIEAMVGRQDAERKAKEEAAYKLSSEKEIQKNTVKNDKPLLEDKTGAVAEGRRGSNGGGRGGRTGRGRWKKSGNKPHNGV